MLLSVYFAALGLGSIGVGLGLLIQGPLALDRRTRRARSDSAWVDNPDALDLHADRSLGLLDGQADELWRPVASVHFWTIGACCFGAGGLVASAAGLRGTGALVAAIAAGVVLGYLAAMGLRALPPRSAG